MGGRAWDTDCLETYIDTKPCAGNGGAAATVSQAGASRTDPWMALKGLWCSAKCPPAL